MESQDDGDIFSEKMKAEGLRVSVVELDIRIFVICSCIDLLKSEEEVYDCGFFSTYPSCPFNIFFGVSMKRKILDDKVKKPRSAENLFLTLSTEFISKRVIINLELLLICLITVKF